LARISNILIKKSYKIMSILAVLGFLFAGYSVMANDSVQTLGTWIGSNKNKFKWYTLWAFASSIMILTLWWAWYSSGGDISFGRLNKIPFVEVQWYHTLAPLVLIFLTRKGIPVSTSFLVLSAFASSFVLEKMLIKSIVGYIIAGGASYGIWWLLSKFVDESKDVKESHKTYWRVAQWVSTSFLWFTWLSHDVANISVFLPRELSPMLLIGVMVFFTLCLGWIFYTNGGKIQEIIVSKKNTKYIRSATLIDLGYAFLLLFFKEWNDIPMSTTWVFVGLLSGRELALNTFLADGKAQKGIFPMLLKDFFKLLIGLMVSVGIVLVIHYFLR